MAQTAKSRQTVLETVVSFLTDHRLDPTPDNYRLGYIHQSGTNPGLSDAIVKATDGGLRLHPDDAAAILLAFTGEAATGALPATGRGDEVEDEDRVALRRQAMRLSELTNSTAKATSDFGRDLEAGIAAIDQDPTGAALRTTVVVMAERAKSAETQLAEAIRDMDALRQDLESARSDASKDALTGLPNRRALEKAMASCEGRQRTVAIVDVDHFKSVNDRFGHAVGDRVLKMVAKTLQETCGPHLVARWGGEEFVILIKDLAPMQATRLLDRARQEMAGKTLKLRETDQPLGTVTFSAGLASSSCAPIADLMSTADALLYESKAAGRNRVTSKSM